MEGSEDVLDEEEFVEKVADALTASGIPAGAQDTGGGIYCVVIPRESGGEIVWGTADFNWGAVVTDENGNVLSSITTSCAIESKDIKTIAEVIRAHLIAAGAAPN